MNATDRNAASVTRYVVTIKGRDGTRTLFDPAQGRWTFASVAEAQARIADFSGTESRNAIDEIYYPGACKTMAVRECACWPGHFDPKGIYFD